MAMTGNLAGPVVPFAWLQTIRGKIGKPDFSTIIVLADLVGLYKPVFDVQSGRWKAPLTYDMAHWRDFGLSEPAWESAMCRLAKRGVTERSEKGKVGLNIDVLKQLGRLLELQRDRLAQCRQLAATLQKTRFCAGEPRNIPSPAPFTSRSPTSGSRIFWPGASLTVAGRMRDCIQPHTPEPPREFCGHPAVSPRSSNMTEAMNAFCNGPGRMKTNKSKIQKSKKKQTKGASGNTDATPNIGTAPPVTSATGSAEKATPGNVAVTQGTEKVVPAISMSPATPQEVARLVEFEAIIEANCKSLFALGEALQVIRDERLYRESFATFEEYCRVRWDFSRIWAHYQINAATTRAALLTTVNNSGLPEPTNERQLRPLSKLKPDAKAAAWKRACEIAGDTEISHCHVEQAVAEIEGKAPGRKSKKRDKEPANERPTVPNGAASGKSDDAGGDSDDTQTESQSDPQNDGRGAENDEVDEKLVSSACLRIEVFVADQIKIFSGPERAKVADQLRALAARICA